MKVNAIEETTREYVIRLVDKMNDFEDVEVEIVTEHLNPESKYFTHCNVKLNTLRNRTIQEHIEYYEAICRGLRELRYL